MFCKEGKIIQKQINQSWGERMREKGMEKGAKSMIRKELLLKQTASRIILPRVKSSLTQIMTCQWQVLPLLFPDVYDTRAKSGLENQLNLVL